MFSSDSIVFKFKKEVLRVNRYNHSQEIRTFLDEFKIKINNNVADVKQNSQLFRAQLGNSIHPVYLNEEYIDDAESPFPPERMKPLSDMAIEGRLNPKGIPYLYLSSTDETAIAETRPWIGQKISVGIFRITKDLKIVHFVENPTKRINTISNEKEGIDKKIWKEINQLFSEPVTINDNTAEYAPTQILSEIVKNNGYDGIAYKSTVGNGINFVLFDLDSAVLTKCRLYETKSVKYNNKIIDNGYSRKFET